jgi:sodium-dependent dicarboxylate transporter 2/3/5
MESHPEHEESSSVRSRKTAGFVLGPLFAALVAGLSLSFGYSPEIVITLAVVTWCAAWWILEPIPIPATSLIPLAVFPTCGVLTAEQVAESYGNKLVLLLMGGFMLSTAMERSGAHRRLALIMVVLFGGGGSGGANPRRIVFGFMAATAILSMWISNAATTLMMLPIALAVLEQTRTARLPICLLLGIAFSASVGGTGTPIGTPPNLIFIENYRQVTGEEVSFPQWMAWSLPIVVIMLPIQALWLTRGLPRIEHLELPDAGRWRSEEVRTLLVFLVTAVLWITRGAPYGGWSNWLNLPGANDASVAILAVVAMHLIPNGKGEPLLTWEDAARIPWGILILCAGGISIAEAFRSTGISEMVGQQLAGLGELTPVFLVGAICLAVTFLTEVTSNTATANLLLPILAVVPVDDPKLVMIPATISASFAFMLPAATFPNAIIFGSGKIHVSEMAREGIVLNLIGAVVVTMVCCWLL